MGILRQAGIVRSVLSFFAPKPLDANVRVSWLPGGECEVTPVFSVDGGEVPATQIGPEKAQRLLGHHVTVTEAARKVLALTKGRQIKLAKAKAAATLKSLSSAGVAIRTADGKSALQIRSARPDVTLELHPDDSLRIASQLVTEEGVVIAKPSDLEALRKDDGWHIDGEDLVKIDVTNSALDNVLIREGGSGTLESHQTPRFLKAVDANRSHLGELSRNDALTQVSVFSGEPSHGVVITGDSEEIRWEPRLRFKSPSGATYDQPESQLERRDPSKATFERVPEGWVELAPATLSEFRKARDDLDKRAQGRRCHTGPDIPKTLALLRDIVRDKSTPTPWNVYYTKTVADAHRLYDAPSTLEFQLNIVESNGRSLLQLDPIYSHDRFRLSHSEAEAAAAAGHDWVRRTNAWVHIDSDRVSKVAASATKLNLTRSGDGFSFAASDREKVLELFSTLGFIRQSESYADFLRKLQDFEFIEEAPRPRNLAAHISLRSYQQHGLNWLAFLQRYGLNGVLADDMGLGKTLQTLAVIERAREVTGSSLPALIICPTSVMLNWKHEIQKFLISSEVAIFHGPGRQGILSRIYATASGQSPSHPLYIVTSYETARIDHEDLNRIPWLYVVIDEGHNIKNPSAKRTRAIKTIAGQHKLALTGTPIQNRLDELWSLFDFAMPGYLGTRAGFQQKYSAGNRLDLNAVQTELVPRIRPFVMRRLKAHVAKDLPEKIIVDHRVELTPAQVSLYKQTIQSGGCKSVLEKVTRDGPARASLQILAVLTQLRNICNHPELLNDPFSAVRASPEHSGKLDHLRDLMEDVMDGDHRTLLFSQSTRVLDILEHLFPSWGVASLRIDGDTPASERARRATEFNTNLRIHCFLLSTKAAGVGLNLTGADTVIFFDHDWNPANDDQAMDRAYRIGQTKNVTVYRLIAKGTIEEKILERQKEKRSLADDVIGSDASGFKDLTREELLELFDLGELA
jgi:superfamily II DNA or RNA helicase